MTASPASRRRGEVMAYREVSVIEVKEVLRLWRSRVPKKQIAGRLGLDPKTVRRYVAAAVEAGLPGPTGPSECDSDVRLSAGATCPPASTPSLIEVTDDEVARVMALIRVRPTGRDRGESWAACIERRVFIAQHLERGIRLSKVRRLLQRASVEIPYTTLHRFAVRELGFGRAAPTIPLVEGKPGEELQVDTGWVGSLEPDERGHRRRFRAWIFTPVVSRYRFVWPCFQETTASAIDACEAAWAFYGGVFGVLLPDNTKAIVADPDALEPTITRAFLEYSQARGFEVDPTRSRRPRDKARVERSVRDVRDDGFAGERIATIDAARERGLVWSRDEYGMRRHTRTRRLPREHFLADEKPALLPAPTESYDIPLWCTPKVARDQHAQVALGLYSLPRRFVGKRLAARADKELVRFYDGCSLVKTHPRVAPGKRSTDRADFPEAQAVYAFRDAAFLESEAAKHGAVVGAFAQALLAGPAPWRRMRQTYALLRLAQRFGGARVEQACRVALDAGAVSVRLVERMVKNGGPIVSSLRASGGPAEPEDRRSRGPSIQDTSAKVISIARFLRPASEYAIARPTDPETKEETT